MKRLLFILPLFISTLLAAHPVEGLLERIERGASSHFIIEQTESETDYFVLKQRGNKVVIEGNSPTSIAVGVNYYLEHYAHVQLSWDCMTAHLPLSLPKIPKPIRQECSSKHRHYLNYCTFSYSTAYWDWERWQIEIDWMALRGVNMALALTGTEVVWKELLTQLGYSEDEVGRFIGGPSYLAWWHMNNLEGWGGPLTKTWYAQQQTLQQQILERMREYGIEPILPGFSGMMPSERSGEEMLPTGKWAGFQRPYFLRPTSRQFAVIAERYYHIMDSLYGKALYYAMDPFHEGGDASHVDLRAAGQNIFRAMTNQHPSATWVIQAWGENPREELIASIPRDQLLVLSLNADADPRNFADNNYIFCSLPNYGGNVGLFGRVDALLEGYKRASKDLNCMGVGIVPEGIENNTIMHHMLYTLPWQKKVNAKEWVEDYIEARYGISNHYVTRAWRLLLKTIYNCPSPLQQGTRESVFCARPSLDVKDVSAWAATTDYYSIGDLQRAYTPLLKAAKRAPQIERNGHYRYDMIDLKRQINAEEGRTTLMRIKEAYVQKDLDSFRAYAEHFLSLIIEQDILLSAVSTMTLGYHMSEADAKATTYEEQRAYRMNLLTQITTWGPRFASEEGRLHDYAHREWSGLLSTLYYSRWQSYFNYLAAELLGEHPTPIDYYLFDTEWCQEYVK